jgi:F-type H+-transporting ATPase subunit delta
LPIEAQRYARALYELASEKKDIAAVETDLLRIKAYLAGSRELRLFLASPLLRRTLTAKGLGEVLKQADVGKLTQGFFNVVAMNGRGPSVPAILEAFFQIAAKARGELRADVTSAHALNEAQQEAVKQAILKAFSAKGARAVHLNAHTDSALLGGMRVQVGSFLYDGSLKGQLERMAPVLKASA